MLLFRLLSLGSETFIQIRTLSGCGIAKMEFDLKFSNGGEKKGPATKPFTIQDAIESVTSMPCLNAAAEFFY
jgi:hypothetical protein